MKYFPCICSSIGAPAAALRVCSLQEAPSGGGVGPAAGDPVPAARQAAGGVLQDGPAVHLCSVSDGGAQRTRHSAG